MADTGSYALSPRARPDRDSASRDRGNGAASERGLPLPHDRLPQRPRARLPRADGRRGALARRQRPAAARAPALPGVAPPGGPHRPRLVALEPAGLAAETGPPPVASAPTPPP